MNRKTKNLIRTVSLVLFFLAAGICNQTAMAQSYGNGETGAELVIDKKIRPIDNKNYFDNIGSGQKIFTEGEQIEFKFVIENRGNRTLTNIKVQDILPKYLTLLVFPGTYTAETNVITTEVVSLDPGQSKELTVLARINGLPVGSSNKLQMTNRVTASATNVYDSDEAKYFVEMKAVPSTGASDILIKTGLALTMIGVAFGTRKLVRGY